MGKGLLIKCARKRLAGSGVQVCQGGAWAHPSNFSYIRAHWFLHFMECGSTAVQSASGIPDEPGAQSGIGLLKIQAHNLSPEKQTKLACISKFKPQTRSAA